MACGLISNEINLAEGACTEDRANTVLTANQGISDAVMIAHSVINFKLKSKIYYRMFKFDNIL